MRTVKIATVRGSRVRTKGPVTRASLRGCLVAALVLAASHVDAGASPPTHVWSSRFGNSSDQYATSVKTEASGNVIVAGTFEGTLNLGAGPLISAGGTDVFVAKYNSSGNIVWNYRFGDAGNQFTQAVAMDAAGNVIITGYFDGTLDFGLGALASAGGQDIFVAKFSALGTPQWSQRFGDASDNWANYVAADYTGNVLVTGQFQGTVDFGGGPLTSAGLSDVFVAKFDPAGIHLWSRRFGDANDSRGFGVACDNGDNVVLTGGFVGSIDFGGGALSSAGSWDVFVAKFDAAGTHQWSGAYGGAGNQYGNALTIDSGGDVIITGLLAGSIDFGGGPLTSAGSYDVFVAKLDAGGAHQWSRRFGDSGFQWAQAVATDGADNVSVTGYFDGTIDFGGGPLTDAGAFDVFVASFDPAGNHRWSQQFGDSKEQLGYSVAADFFGKVVLVGSFAGTVNFGGPPLTSAGARDAFVVKVNSSGVHQWSRRLGEDRDQYGTAVATDASGNVIVAGTFAGTIDLGGGPLTSAGLNDLFIAKFDAAGNHQWSRRFGDSASQFSQSVATDASGNVILAGYFSGSVDFGGGILTASGQDAFVAKFSATGVHLWSRRFGDAAAQVANSVTTDASQNVILAGQFNGTIDLGGGPLTSAGLADIFVAKFDLAGNHVWSQRFGDASDQRGFSVATDASENVILAGGFRGAVDFGGGVRTSAGLNDAFVAKYDAAGVHQWSRNFGDAGEQYSNAVAVDAGGNVILTGLLAGTADFGGGPLTSAGSYDVFVAMFDPAGSHQWSRRFGDAGLQWAQAVATTPGGNVVVTGYFDGAVDFGGGPLIGAGSSDLFVAMLTSAGSHDWSQRFGDAREQLGYAVATDGYGNLIVTGALDGVADFGGGPLTSTGGFDVLVAKFGQDFTVASTVEPWDTYGQALVIPGATGDDLVTITARDAFGNPVPGVHVAIDLSGCGGLCIDTPDGLSGTTNGSGVVQLDPRAGGCEDCPIVVTANGIPIRTWARVVSPDWDGAWADGRVDCRDYLFAWPYVSGATYAPCVDYDGDGSVGISDAGIQLEALESSAANSVTCPRPVSCLAAPAGLSAWFPLDETVGILAYDLTGNPMGTYRNGASHVPGKVAGAASFGAGNQFIEAPSAGPMNFGTGSFTAAAWVRTASTLASVRTILDKRSGSPLQGYSMYIYSGRPGFQVASAGNYNNFNAPDGVLTDGAWHHVVGVVDRAGGVSGGHLFVDGTEVLTFDPTQVPQDVSNPGSFRIGQAFDSGSADFDGQIDEVQLFNRALNENEICALFSAQAAGLCKPVASVPGGAGDGASRLLTVSTGVLRSGDLVISLALDVPEEVELRAYDISGRLVRTIVAADREIRWDGTSGSGQALPKGLYFIRAETRSSHRVDVRRVVLLK